jgi:hypothetical protein
VSKGVVYVAGPLTQGDMAVNIRKAIDAANELRDMGYTPIVPHLSFYWHTIHQREYEDWLAMDFELIERCDVMLRIPGYSPGADREVAEAVRIGIPVFDSISDLARFWNGRVQFDTEG